MKYTDDELKPQASYGDDPERIKALQEEYRKQKEFEDSLDPDALFSIYSNR